MSLKKKLRKFSKNELIQMLLDERKARQELEKRIKKLEQYLKAFDNPHTPSSKQQKRNIKKDNDEKTPRFPGKPVGSKGGGIRLPKPDKIVEHKLDICPISGLPLGKPVGYWKKTVIDFPDKPIMVVEHRIMKYISPATGEIVTADVSLPKGIYGKNIQSIIEFFGKICLRLSALKKCIDYV